MIDAVWKNDLRGIAIFRLGQCTWFQLANKMQFLIECSPPKSDNVSVAVIVVGLTIHSSIKLASHDWQTRKNPRSRSRRRPAVLRSAYPTPDPQPGDRVVVVEGWPAGRRIRQAGLENGGLPAGGNRDHRGPAEPGGKKRRGP